MIDKYGLEYKLNIDFNVLHRTTDNLRVTDNSRRVSRVVRESARDPE